MFYFCLNKCLKFRLTYSNTYWHSHSDAKLTFFIAYGLITLNVLFQTRSQLVIFEREECLFTTAEGLFGQLGWHMSQPLTETCIRNKIKENVFCGISSCFVTPGLVTWLGEYEMKHASIFVHTGVLGRGWGSRLGNVLFYSRAKYMLLSIKHAIIFRTKVIHPPPPPGSQMLHDESTSSLFRPCSLQQTPSHLHH